MRIYNYVGLTVLGLGLFAACGGDDDEGSSGGGSYSSISESISAPSGTVDATTVGDIGEEFAKISSASAGGVREDAVAQSSQTQEMACPAGGTQTSTASGTQDNATVTIDLDACCYTEGCCTTGGGTWYFAGAQGAEYSICGSYDVTSSCQGSTVSLDYSGCIGSNGQWVYVVEVAGETYAVSGNYANGNGMLEITGANGTWTCTYANGAGNCTGTGGDFTF